MMASQRTVIAFVLAFIYVSSDSRSMSLSLSNELLDRIVNDHKLQVSRECYNSLVYLRQSLDDLHDAQWPSQMANSLLAVPPDIRAGRNLANFGEYDTCLNIYTGHSLKRNNHLSTKGESVSWRSISNHISSQSSMRDKMFSGQYCLYRQHFNFTDPSVMQLLSSKPQKYEVFLKTCETVTGSVCLPSTCNGQDVHNVISKHLAASGTTIELRNGCETAATFSNDTSHYPWLTLLLVWIVFVIIAPLLVDTNGTSVLNRVVACFSIHKNYLQLTKKDTNEFDFLYGLRFIFLVTSTYLHVFLFSFLWVPQAVLNILNFNASLLFKLTSTSWTNGMSYNFVWAAFVGFFSRINSDKKVLTTSEFILALLSRFLRTVPTVLGCYLLILAVPRSLGSGPLWNASLDKIRQNCRTGAWRELTYTQNIINPSDMCLMPSWIVAPDLHFFIASLFIITLYRYHAFLCKLLLTGGVFMGVLLQALYLLYTNSPGLIDFTKYDRALFNQYSGIHTNTVNYISSYMLGMLTAITCHEKMKTSHRFVPTMLCGVTGFMVLCMEMWRLSWDWRSPDRLEEIIFASTHKTVAAIFCSSFVYWFYNHPDNLITNIFSLSVFRFIIRFNFSIYLGHFIFMYYDLFTSTVPVEFSNYQFISRTLYVLAWSFSIGLIIYLLFEAPFIRLSKVVVDLLRPVICSSRLTTSPSSTSSPTRTEKSRSDITHVFNSPPISLVRMMVDFAKNTLTPSDLRIRLYASPPRSKLELNNNSPECSKLQ